MSKANKTRSWAILLGSFAVLIISSLLARGRSLIIGEEEMLRFVYRLPDSLRYAFLVVTLLGSAWVLAVVLIWLFIKKRFDIGLRVIVAGLSTYFIAGLAKELVARPRPSNLLPNLLPRELMVAGYGFPSAHTALATALAVVIGVYLPAKWRFIVPVWIVSVAISRLYLGVHAPLDIIGGFCIGLIVAMCVIIALPPLKLIPRFRIAKKLKQA